MTAIDAAPEVLAVNRARVDDDSVRYVEADLFDWSPDERFDACVFAFWLSHVPEARFADFWDMVAGCLKPGGRVLFIDSARTERSTAADHVLPSGGDDTMTRRLDDGREFQIIKRFYEPAELEGALAELGWSAVGGRDAASSSSTGPLNLGVARSPRPRQLRLGKGPSYASRTARP